ncbi:MAG: 23S rRNA (guanosine(2251)-2'-O)-methyltransferase RlmB [Alphaproteobacteria bacterium]|nr:23S rRNA (guanosine(2251)-2'-O)-methyltransferase RlmB [Alphaproteobacteria bacterium]
MKNKMDMRKPHSRQRACLTGRVILYGFHAVTAALQNEARHCISLRATSRAAERIHSLALRRDIPVTLSSATEIDRKIGYEAVHQGLLLEACPLLLPSLEMLDPQAPVIALDHVTDPRNVGAILRSATAFGAGAIISQERHAPPPSGALAKAAAGALEHVPYLQVTNLSRTLTWFKRNGRWIIGLDSEGKETLQKITGHNPMVLLLGAEGSGLRKLNKDHCDLITRINLPGKIKSLNVSNAAAIALYAVQKKTEET